MSLPQSSPSSLVQRTIALLRIVAASPEGIGLSEIARVSGIPKATCHRVLTILQQEGLIAVDTTTKRYGVSLGLMSLVAAFLGEQSAHVLVLRELKDLANDAQETAGLDVLDERGVIVVLQVQGPHLISQTAKPVPRTLPVWCTSTGKVLTAWRPSQYLDDYIRSGVPTEEAWQRYLKDLEKVRGTGFGVAFNELERGAAAIAAPVRVRGNVVAAVWIGGPSFRITRGRILELSRRVVTSASRLSELLSAYEVWVLPGQDSVPLPDSRQ
jgi:IclR family transcriptional regulator, acetate operon repressor